MKVLSKVLPAPPMFVPVELTITLETYDEVIILWNLFNMSDRNVINSVTDDTEKSQLISCLRTNPDFIQNLWAAINPYR